MKILVLPKYHTDGSSSRYRYYHYFKWFLEEHHSITSKPLLYDGYVQDLYKNKNRIKRIRMTFAGILDRIFFLLRNKKKFDIIIIEKELVTYLPFSIEKFLLRGVKFIVDYDDNINARYQTGFAKIFLSKKIMCIGKLANAITVGNHWYFDFYKDIDPIKVYYLPTVIDRELYAATNITKQVDQPLTIVWIGSPGNAKYLKRIDELLARLQSIYHFKLKIIGATIQLNCAADYVEWNAATEIAELKQSDIGIMPLDDTDWEKGKCGFKLIQYMACGLPVVASYSVANTEIVDNGCGFIAKTNEDWFDFLSQLLQSTNMRNEFGKNGKASVYDHYSYQVWAPVFVKLVNAAGTRK